LWALSPAPPLRGERPTLAQRRAAGDPQGEGELTARGRPGWVLQAGWLKAKIAPDWYVWGVQV